MSDGDPREALGSAGSGPAHDSEISGTPPATSAAAAASPFETTTRRPIRLTILLGIVGALNFIGLVRGLMSRERLMSEIPGLTPTLYAGWIAAAVLALIGVAGLWNLRRWGFYVLGLSWIVVIAVDLTVGALNHVIVATAVMGLVVLFVQPVRAALK